MAGCLVEGGQVPTVGRFQRIAAQLGFTIGHKPDGAVHLGKWDQFMAEQFSRFLGRLDSVSEGDTTLLDNSVVLYGSSNSQTHNNQNYPLVLAGGNRLGMKHGQYLKLSDKVPMSNLFVTIHEPNGRRPRSFC